jgi:enoyl-CoA hydratase
MTAPFEIEIDGHVATLWLSNPDRRNAMGPDFWRDLPGVVAEIDANEQVRAAHISAWASI